MGFSFRAMYQWFLEQGFSNNFIKEDEFINTGLNGYNCTLFVELYDALRLKDSWVKHHQATVEIKCKKIALLEAEILKLKESINGLTNAVPTKI